MDSSKIKAVIILTMAVFAALYLGISAATAQLETLIVVTVSVGLASCILLGRRIWMLIPFMGSLSLGLMIPGRPNTILVAQALLIGFSLLLFLIRKLPAKFFFTELEFWTLLLFLTVLQAYARNPTGLNILGGESLGGRPYALFAIGLVSCVLLSSLKIPPLDLKWILRLSIIGGLLNFFMLTIGHFIPSVGMWYGANLANQQEGGFERGGAYGEDRANRIVFVRKIAANLSLWISCIKDPLKACFHPIWAPLILLSFAFAAFSGYRNDVGAVGLTYLVAIAYRGGRPSLMISLFSLFAGISFLAFINLAAPLPLNVQRSLSFLPGTWDESVVQDANDSTDWRVEMWKEALLTDIWIQNKLLGDGLGMTRQEFNYIQSFEDKVIGGAVGSGKLTLQQEFMMASGSYHSGPVSTIRATGYLGLIILVLAQIRLGVHAHRQILRARGTEWFPLALFIGIPRIWAPFFFVFVFGDYGPALAELLMGIAMIRILENNLALPNYSPVQKQAQTIIPRRSSRHVMAKPQTP